MSILPSTTSELERKLESLGERYDLGVVIKSLWDSWNCPAELLIYLAWALSVDEWNEDWPEDVRRNVCATSLDIHRMKGTTKSMQDSVNALGHDALIVYRKDIPEIPKGKFRVRVKANNQEITQSFYDEMLRVINENKRGTLHLDKFEISSGSRVDLKVVTFTKIAEHFKIFPISNMEIKQELNLSLGALTMVIERITTKPLI